MNETISLGSAKDHVSTVAHHASSDQRRGILFGTVGTRVAFESQIALPKLPRLSVSGCYRIGVLAVADRLHAVLRIKMLELRNLSASHHSADTTHRPTLLRDRCSRLCYLL